MPPWSDFVAALDLFRDAILCGAVAGLVLGAAGLFVVLRRMVFLTAVTSQSAGLGVALAFYAGIHWDLEVPPVVGAAVFALLATMLLMVRVDRLRLARESLLGLGYVIAGGAAIVVGSRITQEGHDIAGILFGSAVLVRPEDLYMVSGAGAIVLIALVWAWRGLLFASFDPDGARVAGLPVGALDLVLAVMLALQISVSTRALGSLPVFAFTVLPAIAALALVRDVRWAAVLAAGIGAMAGAVGYMAAFFLATPVGASQALIAGVVAVLALATVPLRR